MSIPPELFRDVFRRWPSGVAVATSVHNGQRHGMVVGSFCSLSSAPPLVMISAGTASRTHEFISASGIFAVSILAEPQVTLFERFAGFDRSSDQDRFAGFSTIVAETGAPIFPDALAWVDCQVVDRHSGAGYTIFVGEVVAASLGESAEAAPLVYFRRRHRRLHDAAP